MLDSKKYGPWAVIPGGSEGLGESFANKIGQAGINVVLIARKEEPLENVARKIRANPAFRYTRCHSISRDQICWSASRPSPTISTWDL